ncbi:MAG: PUR family DNA/RNA-binding protein [Bacteroidales bacterium]|nr:PUR family DNA/RNA-binding protein [Bacteroidales bacterium]
MENSNQEREEVFSKSVKAGKRTYFFDVKKTKTNDYFLTITESKRIFESEEKVSYEKHKIFLYQEDFEKFLEGMKNAVDFVTEENPNFVPRSESRKESENSDFSF